MEFPRLTEEQLRANNSEFNALIANIRHINPLLADLLMMNRNKLERHVKAQESELEAMDRRSVCMD